MSSFLAAKVLRSTPFSIFDWQPKHLGFDCDGSLFFAKKLQSNAIATCWDLDELVLTEAVSLALISPLTYFSSSYTILSIVLVKSKGWQAPSWVFCLFCFLPRYCTLRFSFSGLPFADAQSNSVDGACRQANANVLRSSDRLISDTCSKPTKPVPPWKCSSRFFWCQQFATYSISSYSARRIGQPGKPEEPPACCGADLRIQKNNQLARAPEVQSMTGL